MPIFLKPVNNDQLQNSYQVYILTPQLLFHVPHKMPLETLLKLPHSSQKHQQNLFNNIILLEIYSNQRYNTRSLNKFTLF